MIAERLQQLRQAMAQRGMDAYLIPTADFHGSEYVGEHFKVREYFSGFTGSAGTLVVGPEEAGLWTDGRYFLQAEQELQGSGIRLYRMGVEGTPDVEDYLARSLPPEGVLGADGRMVDAAWGVALARALGPGRRLAFDQDLATLLWTDRPPLPQAPAYRLTEDYAGVSAEDKLADLRREMERLGVDAHLITALDQIAWLFNLRGEDVACNPVVLSYALVEREGATLFVDGAKLSPALRAYLEELGVSIRPYEAVEEGLRSCRSKRILADARRTNYTLYRLLPEEAVVDGVSPILYAKAVKNPVEQAHLREAHIRDGVAMVKLLHWLKTEGVGATECEVARRVDGLRLEQEGCVGPSFDTISAYGPHGAIVHYHATEQSEVPLEGRGLFLLDSGGQYRQGTTDITRTVAMGPLSAEERKHFTLVLQGMLNLSEAVFPRGCRGYHLDVLARSPLWQQGLDYGHGTGHGIGYLLCVHEPPVGFHWRSTGRFDTEVLQPGMVLSDEPGVYIPGSHGIRIENQLLCREGEQEGFLCFETLTLVPIDRDAVDLNWLDRRGLEQLNAYHRRVWETLSPHLEGEVLAWLEQATQPLG